MSLLEEAVAPYRGPIDSALREALSHDGVGIYPMLRYFMGFEDETGSLIDAKGGKRVRPALLLLVADAFGGAGGAMDLAVACELFHNFTLIHDDIEDGDELRRGRPTLWKRWGINHGINSGDAQAFITARFLLTASTVDEAHLRAARLLNEKFLEVIEGQYLDFELTGMALADAGVTETAYLEMTRKKTSVLIGVAAAAGGVSAGCDATAQNDLYIYGESLGLAYQIADDIASLWGATETTGKAQWGDVYERKKTLPVLYARTENLTHDRLCELYALPRRLSDSEAGEIMAIIDATDAYTKSKALALSYAKVAKAAAQRLPVSVTIKDSLAAIVDGFVTFPK